MPACVTQNHCASVGRWADEKDLARFWVAGAKRTVQLVAGVRVRPRVGVTIRVRARVLVAAAKRTVDLRVG